MTGDYFLHCFRMSPAVFEELLCLVASHTSKKKTKLRQPISPSERLCTGHAFVTIGASLPWLTNIMLNLLIKSSFDISLLLKLKFAVTLLLNYIVHCKYVML